MNSNITKYLPLILLIFTVILISSCTKNVPPEMIDKNKKTTMNNSQMPNDSIHKNIKQDGQTQTSTDDTKGDDKAEQIQKEADDADAKYMKSKSDVDKKEAVTKQLSAANYLMFEANLAPKKKYRPALKRYKRVLELDPNNQEAAANKKQIEDIYQSMGMPVPDL